MAEKKMKEEVCCPKFDPKPWDEKEIVLKNRLFVKANVICFLHMPLNFGNVMKKVCKIIDKQKANVDTKDWLMLSDESSLWKSVQYIAVKKDIKGMENTRLSGKFLTKVYEGPFKEVGNWYADIMNYTKRKTGKKPKKIYAYYTTCPKCAKKYGKNYVVMFAQVL